MEGLKYEEDIEENEQHLFVDSNLNKLLKDSKTNPYLNRLYYTKDHAQTDFTLNNHSIFVWYKKFLSQLPITA